MAHHAYVVSGLLAEGLTQARAFGEQVLAIPSGSPDLLVLSYSLFPAAAARQIGDFAAQTPIAGPNKLIVIVAGRIFHEAQNALLKVFEEPPEGTTLILVIPTEGLLLPTLRSRLLPLPKTDIGPDAPGMVHDFLSATESERKKFVEKLLAKSKSDKDEEKQQARLEAAALIDGLTKVVYSAPPSPEINALLSDLARFAPIMHERSAPLKLIFEHLLITLPPSLSK